MNTTHVFKNLTLATLVPGETPYGLMSNTTIALEDGLIAWIGKYVDLPHRFSQVKQHDLENCLVTPALIDCHTHVIHGGNRAHEFEMRLQGATYESIGRLGGGIISTVNATKTLTIESLLERALPRVDALIAEGVTTLEIKSGYGLDQNTELNMLRAARTIAQKRSICVQNTFLGAHSIPPEYADRSDAYIDEICIPTLEQAHAEGIVDAVDGFCERLAFTPQQIERVFIKARTLNLPVKLHAEQLSNTGGIKLAASYGALSVDHLEYAHEDDIAAMQKTGVVAVLLPGAFYTLREKQLPPIEALRAYKIPIALATDCNPGSSPLSSILLAMNMACTLFRLTPEEALAGVTLNAAKALGLHNRGCIQEGMRADLAVWNVENPAELSYRIGFNPLRARIFGGQIDSR